jgi:hypothetical protein
MAAGIGFVIGFHHDLDIVDRWFQSSARLAIVVIVRRP